MGAVRVLVSLAILFPAVVATPVHAAVYVTQSGEIRPVRVRAVVSRDESLTDLLQATEVRSTATRAIWLTPFPNPPDVAVKDGVRFEDLDALTTVESPFNQLIRADVFGPSVVTLFRAQRRAKPPAEALGPGRTLSIADFAVFSGEIQTSTITGLRIPPPSMAAWFEDRAVPISDALLGSLSGYLNREWVVVAIEIEDAAPNARAPAYVPAVQFSFRSEQPLFPLMRAPQRQAEGPVFDLWTVADQPLTPTTYRAEWIRRPWTVAEPPPGKMTAIYSRSILAGDEADRIFKEQLDLPLPPTPHLVRHRLVHGAEVWAEIPFRPAVQWTSIPGFGQRGSAVDIILCFLIGLAPLLFAPESWLLAFLSSGSRRTGRPNLWAYYAVVVSVYWVVTLEGVGRVAAVAPLAVGLTQLLWGDEPERDEFVRVNYPRKAPVNR